MRIMDSGKLKALVVLVGVAVLTGAIGVVVSAQMGARRGQAGAQASGGQGGPGMMGQGFGMHGGPGGRGGGPFGMFGPELRGLDLTEAQHQQVRGILESHQAEIRAIEEKAMPARKALQDAITNDTFDEAAIRTAAAAVSAVDADVAVLRAKVHAAVFAVLTPEQQQKAKELRSQMEQRMQDGRGRGPGRGGMMERMMERFLHQPAPKPSQNSEGVSEQEPSRPETV